MLITLTDSTLLPDLLAFLRSAGCVAYVPGGSETIEAMRPYSFEQKEAFEIRTLVEHWLREHPDVQVDLVAD